MADSVRSKRCPYSSSCPEVVFMGREWVFAKLAKTLDLRIECPNTTVLMGSPGSGKSFLLRHLLKSSRFKDNVLAFYECHEYSDAFNFIVNVEKQLNQRVQLNQTKQEDETTKTGTGNGEAEAGEDATEPDEMFQRVILFPLLEADLVNAEDQRYLLVVDAIDLKRDICEMISRHIHLLPKWLHLIVSARPKRRRGFTKMFSGSRKIVIDDMRKVNVINDMKCYIVHRIKTMNRSPLAHSAKKALNQIGIKSNGCFLYVKLILDYIERGLFEIEKEEIGATLNGLYLAICTKLFNEKPSHEFVYKLIISTVLASDGHRIGRNALKRILGNESNFDQRLEELLLYSLIRIDEEEEDQEVEVSHSSLIEWITDVKFCTKRFLCQPGLGHTLLALSREQLDITERCYHVTHAEISELHVYHYALWLLLRCSNEEMNCLMEAVDDFIIVDYIKRCKEAISKLDKGNNCSQIDEVAYCPSLVPVLCPERPDHGDVGTSVVDQQIRAPLDIPYPYEESPEDEDVHLLLIDAIRGKNVVKVQQILSNDPDLVNRVDVVSGHKSPLFCAIEQKDKDLVELLTEFDADVNEEGEDGSTPLMLATRMSLDEICEILLEADADVDASDTMGRTPLVYAVLYGSAAKVVEMLLFWGAHTDFMDGEGRSLLGIAANHSQANVQVTRLLLAVGCDELHKDNCGRTPLHLAATLGHSEVLEALCDVGGEILLNSRDNEGRIALHDSSANGHFNATKLLFTEENINLLSHDGKSSLRMAAFNGHFDVVTLLAENGANMDYIDADGRSTLYCIASSSDDDPGAVKMVQHLAILGVNLESPDFEGRTSLHVASWQGLTKTVEVLIEAGANLEAIDNEGRTPLHMCAWNGFPEVVSLLVEAGANMNHISTTQGATPLLIAAQQGNIDVCAHLLAAGANPTHHDSYSRNARDVAINCGHRDIAILIESHSSNGTADQCPTLSSHASTAETAPVDDMADVDPFYNCSLPKSKHEKPSKSNEGNNRKHKAKVSISSKLTKLLH